MDVLKEHNVFVCEQNVRSHVHISNI